MKKNLKKIEKCYYYKDGKKVFGIHENISGDVSYIRGDVSNINGNVSNIYGDVSDINGNVSGIYGDATDICGNVSGIRGRVTDISGNLDECEITDEERKNGIDIENLSV